MAEGKCYNAVMKAVKIRAVNLIHKAGKNLIWGVA